MKTYNIVLDKPSVTWVITKGIDSRIDSEYYSSIYLKKQLIEQENPLDYCELGSLGKGFSYGTPPYGNMAEQGVPYLRIPNIEDQFFLNDDLAFINEDYHLKNIRNEVDKGDILFRIKGQLGQAVVVPKRYAGAHTGSSFLKFTPTFIDPYFLVLYLSSSYGKNQILRKQSNSIIKYLNIDDIKSIKVPVPSPEIQKYIGDKVRRAEELREEAITLQKDIDILLDVDMLLEETDRINNIFHSKVNWTNEINIVDRIDPNFYQKKYRTTIEKLGDNKVELGELVKISKRRYQTGDINKYIEISSINNSFGTIDEVEELRPEEIPTSAKHQVKEGDILVSLVRPTRKAISIVTKEYDNAICTGGFAVLQSKGKVPVEFLTAVLRTNFAGIQFERYCTGSTYPTINENDVVKIFIPQYSEKQINKIAEKYRRIIESIYRSKKLIQEAKQDVEDLIEGNFEMSKLNNDSSTESRC